MFYKSLAVVFAAAALSVSALEIQTPEELTQCATVEIKWSGKKAPFVLAVLPSCESEDPDRVLMEFPNLGGNSYWWTVNLTSSTGAVAFAITDNEGNEAYTDEVGIGKSDNGDCLPGAKPKTTSSSAPPETSTSTSYSSSTSISTSTSTSSSLSSSTPHAAPSTLVLSQSYAVKASPAPVNVGSGNSHSSASASPSPTGSGTGVSVNGAIAPAASAALASLIGLATAFLVL